MTWDPRVTRCPGCGRSVLGLTYGASGLCERCVAELERYQAAVRILRRGDPMQSAEAALGCVLHNLGLGETAMRLGVDEHEVRRMVLEGLVDERCVNAVLTAWRETTERPVGKGNGRVRGRVPGRRYPPPLETGGVTEPASGVALPPKKIPPRRTGT